MQAYIRIGLAEELISKCHSHWGNWLDKAVVPANVEVQKRCFGSGAMAKDAGLPIIVHVRKAFRNAASA